MNRLSARYDTCGATLVEMLVVISVLSIVLLPVCEAYIAIQKNWDRLRGAEDARSTARQAISQVTPYLQQAFSVTTTTRFTPNDMVVATMPMDQAYGIYVQQGGMYRYRPAPHPVYFYLSDSTGSLTKNGNILWRAVWNSAAGAMAPDTSWSLYPGSTKGQIAPVKSLSFSVDTSGFSPRATMTVTTEYAVDGANHNVVLSADTCVRNTDD